MRVYCANCMYLHLDVTLPHTCSCGHLMEEKNLHTIYRGHWGDGAIDAIIAAEDERVFRLLDEVEKQYPQRVEDRDPKP